MPKLHPDMSLADLDKLTAEIDAIKKQKHRAKHELLGALILRKVLDNPADSSLKSDLLALLAAELTKDKDREAFGLAPLAKAATKPKGKKKPPGAAVEAA